MPSRCFPAVLLNRVCRHGRGRPGSRAEVVAPLPLWGEDLGHYYYYYYYYDYDYYYYYYYYYYDDYYYYYYYYYYLLTY